MTESEAQIIIDHMHDNYPFVGLGADWIDEVWYLGEHDRFYEDDGGSFLLFDHKEGGPTAGHPARPTPQSFFTHVTRHYEPSGEWERDEIVEDFTTPKQVLAFLEKVEKDRDHAEKVRKHHGVKISTPDHIPLV